MAKMRVHELAKELGLENKALLELCTNLSISGKTSHSNTLSDDEADKVRRFVIRKSVAAEKDGDVQEKRIEGKLVTEKRVGAKVIRRRKKANQTEAPKEEKIELSIKSEDLPPSRDLPTLAPDLEKEHKNRKDALEAADAIFKKDKAEPKEEAQKEEVSASAEETTKEEVVVKEDSAQLNGNQEPVNAVANGNGSVDELRKKHDVRAPKVLGKIQLEEPKPKQVKPDSDNQGPNASGPDASKPDRGGTKSKRKKVHGGAADKASKRSRKKQVLNKKQLIDYEGEKDNWRSKKNRKRGPSVPREASPKKASKRIVKVDGQISVGELARQLGLKAGEVIGKLMGLGMMVNINQFVDLDTATLIAEEYEFTVQNVENSVDELVQTLTKEEDESKLVSRPPVVTVMGHVDHGKTSLLDAIRKTEVTQGEHGGITQHIGAYNVEVAGGGSVTFLDTPGHEAFTAMRMRGASVTDIVVLVVAANDGVMPQTIEAINHAKAAEVPIVVAVNKIDVEDASPEKVINQLSEHGLVPEDWGGDTLIVKVSAITGEGVDTLLETLHLQSEILELNANPDRRATGAVIESRIDKGRGAVISVLVKSGTLKKGDCFVAGGVSGKIRAIISDDGKNLDTAGPSIPVEILGASEAAIAGDDFLVCENDSQARQIAEERQEKLRRKRLSSQVSSATNGSQLTLEKFSEIMADSAEMKELPLIVKADVQGSVEAVSTTLGDLSNEEVRVKVIHKAVGAINENDVQLASASGAIVIAFNVRPDPRASQLIEKSGVDMLFSRVIYDLVESVNSALKGKMAPKFKEKTLGHVEVRQTFKVPKLGVVAGSYVTDGVVQRGASVRLLRDGTVMFEGTMASLRRFKDDVKEVATGYECGIGLDGYSDIKDGDLMEIFKVEEVAIV